MKELLSELYQVLGELNAPANVLDQVAAAAAGQPLPHATLLPFDLEMDPVGHVTGTMHGDVNGNTFFEVKLVGRRRLPFMGQSVYVGQPPSGLPTLAQQLLAALKGVTLTQDEIDVGTTAGEEQHAAARQAIAAAKQAQVEPASQQWMLPAHQIIKLANDHFENGGSSVLRTANNCIAEIQELARLLLPTALPDGDLPDAVIEATADAIGDAYDCVRVWEAWSVGTMGPDDFLQVADDGDRVAEIARAAITAWLGDQAAIKDSLTTGRQVEPVNQQVLAALKNAADALERAEFFDEAKNAHAVIAAAEQAQQAEPMSRAGYKHYIVSEPDLLHLMSVKIGAAYTCVQDASERTGIPVSLAQQPDQQQAEPVACEFFAYDPECGFETFKTEAEAKKYAQDSIDSYREEASEGWSELVNNVCWGVVLGTTREVALPDEYSGGNGLADDMKPVDYVLTDAQPPAVAAAAPDVVEQIAQQWDGCMYDSADGCHIDIGQDIRQAGQRFAAAPLAPAPALDEEECLHDFVMFRSECVKCGLPYAAAQEGGA